MHYMNTDIFLIGIKRLAIIILFQVSQKLVSISNNGEKINDFIGLIGPADPTKLTLISALPYEPRYEKTGFLHMGKQRRRSASAPLFSLLG